MRCLKGLRSMGSNDNRKKGAKLRNRNTTWPPWILQLFSNIWSHWWFNATTKQAVVMEMRNFFCFCWLPARKEKTIFALSVVTLNELYRCIVCQIFEVTFGCFALQSFFGRLVSCLPRSSLWTKELWKTYYWLTKANFDYIMDTWEPWMPEVSSRQIWLQKRKCISCLSQSMWSNCQQSVRSEEPWECRRSRTLF